MAEGDASTFEGTETRFLRRAPLPRAYANYWGRQFLLFLLTIQGLGAFALITLGVFVQKFLVAQNVIWPLMRRETARAGVRLLPMFLFVAGALRLLVTGQPMSTDGLLRAARYLGSVMVSVVVCELGLLLAALLMLARVGTPNVAELGTAR